MQDAAETTGTPSAAALARTPDAVRKRLRERRLRYRCELQAESVRLARAAAGLGATKVVLFGSAAWGDPGLASDIDLLLVWDTPLEFVARTAELYRLLRPRVAADLVAYTPAEIARMADRPFVARALREGKVLYEA